MNSSRIAVAAAVGAALCWTAKSVAIGTAGGLDESPLESPLFLAGLGCFVVSVIALGVAATDGRPGWARAGAGVLAVAVGITVTSVVGAIVNAIEAPSSQRHWAWTEVNLWIIAVGALALALAVRRRHLVRLLDADTADQHRVPDAARVR